MIGLRAVGVLAVVGCLLGVGTASALTGGSSSTAAPPRCTPSQLKLSGSFQGATQSLRGVFRLANRRAHACALPVAARRVSLFVGSHEFPTLTVRMSDRTAPPGTPTRLLPGHGHVSVAFRWSNWCGVPRGNLRVVLALTLFSRFSASDPLGTVTTPVCVDHNLSSRVAVSRFYIAP